MDNKSNAVDWPETEVADWDVPGGGAMAGRG